MDRNNDNDCYVCKDSVYPNSTFIKQINGCKWINRGVLVGRVLDSAGTFYVFENTKYGEYVVLKKNCKSLDLL